MAKQGLKKIAYDHVRNAIMSYEYQPGQMLVEQDLSSLLGISRTPIREALKQLESEGLVQHIPSVGTLVVDVSVQDIEEVFQLRTLFEITALKTAIVEIEDAELHAVEEELFALDDMRLDDQQAKEEYYRSDRALHDLVLKYSHNSRMISIHKNLSAQVERLRRISSLTPMRLSKSRQEHMVIINALRSRDLKTAIFALTMHLDNVKDSTIAVCKGLRR